MKNHLGIIVIIVFLSFSSVGCEDLLDLLTFESKEYTLEFVVNPGSIRQDITFLRKKLYNQISIAFLMRMTFQKNGLKKFNVKEAIAMITSPDTTVFFDPLTSFAVTIYTDSLGETTIAEMDPVPDGLRELSLAT